MAEKASRLLRLALADTLNFNVLVTTTVLSAKLSRLLRGFLHLCPKFLRPLAVEPSSKDRHNGQHVLPKLLCSIRVVSEIR